MIKRKLSIAVQNFFTDDGCGIGDTQKNEKKFEKGIDNLMPRTKRRWVLQDCGSFHIISRLAGNNNLFNSEAIREHSNNSSIRVNSWDS